MEETGNSIKDAIKERLTNPFLGKLLSAWIIWNWKISYITFFVSEKYIKEDNKLEFVSNYLYPNSFLDFCNIYIVPLIITAILIWVVPIISNEVYKISENRRKERAVKKKEIDNEISGFKDKQLENLEIEVETFKRQIKDESVINRELRLLVEYLGYEIEYLQDEENKNENEQFEEQFFNEIVYKNNRDRVFILLADFHENRYFEDLSEIEKAFLIKNGIIVNGPGTLELSPFGEFISKNVLFAKYSDHLNNFNLWTDIHN